MTNVTYIAEYQNRKATEALEELASIDQIDIADLWGFLRRSDFDAVRKRSPSFFFPDPDSAA